MSAAGEWMPIEEAPSGQKLLVCYASRRGKWHFVTARRIEKFTEEDNGDCDYSDNAEYDEKTDTYYWPPGWYETNDAQGVDWAMTDEPTHWQPLPTPPGASDDR